MNSVEAVIEVPSSLRYRLIIPEGPVKHIVYVLHGYGQLVAYFHLKFAGVASNDTLFVFPEGRHRFYLKGTSGRVGASWMTREWREEDIRLNVLSLDLLHREISQKYPAEKITVLGFSQGGATAARWLAYGKINCDHFISWASVYPPDLEIEEYTSVAKKCTFVLGTEDEYFPAPEQEALISGYRSKGIQIARFEGKHDIHEETLIALL
ncbi:dienelactone hydrolase family protein [Fluviicola sp.]|uniref:alpha/beta hydrolase n=1 Tax=Fluviicola sp. TaxID=1917219 RepID=UPI0026292C1C|nr:dienelactone hydrolase family protein [Fluviicola sp.]